MSRSELDDGLLGHLKSVGTPRAPDRIKDLNSQCQDFAADHQMIGLKWQTENLTADRYKPTSITANFDEDLERIRALRINLADQIKLFPEAGDGQFTQYGNEWISQVFGEIPLWTRNYLSLMGIYPYRCFTAADYQTEGHLNFVTVLALTGEVSIVHSGHFWVPYAGQVANQGGGSLYNWSSLYPTTAYNDVTLAGEFSESIWTHLIPAVKHLFCSQIQANMRTLRRHTSIGWLPYLWLEVHQNGKLRPGGRNGVGALLDGGDQSGVVSESKLPPLNFAAIGLQEMSDLYTPFMGGVFLAIMEIPRLVACYEQLDSELDQTFAGRHALLMLGLRDPMSRGRDKCVEAIRRGELYTFYLPFLVEAEKLLRRSGQDEEADRIKEVLHCNFGNWTSDEGAEEVLKQLLIKYNTAELILKHVLSVMIPDWAASLDSMNRKLGFPLNAIYGPLCFMFGSDRQTTDDLKVEDCAALLRTIANQMIPTQERAFFQESGAYRQF